MSQIIIRKSTENDLDTINKLIIQLGYDLSTNEMKYCYTLISSYPDHNLILVADTGRQIVGLLHMQIRNTLLNGTWAEIVSMVVDEKYRGNSIGSELIAKAESWAFKRNINQVVLYSNIIREAAHRFYYRHGYSMVKNSYVFKKELNYPQEVNKDV